MATFPLLLCATIQTVFHCIRQAKRASHILHVGSPRPRDLRHGKPDIDLPLWRHTSEGRANMSNELSDEQLDLASGAGWSFATTGGGGAVSNGTEMSMLQIQSLMSQRQQAVTLASNMLGSMNDSQKSVIDNIR
jgi:hypothetical protein